MLSSMPPLLPSLDKLVQVVIRALIGEVGLPFGDCVGLVPGGIGQLVGSPPGSMGPPFIGCLFSARPSRSERCLVECR